MALDTSIFDAKIDEKNQATAIIQTDLDNDPDQIKLKAIQKKADDIRALVAERTEIEVKKEKAISIDAQIRQLDATKADLVDQLEALKTSVS